MGGMHVQEGGNCSKCRVAPSVSIETERREGGDVRPPDKRHLGPWLSHEPVSRKKCSMGTEKSSDRTAFQRNFPGFFQPPSKMNSDPITKVSRTRSRAKIRQGIVRGFFHRTRRSGFLNFFHNSAVRKIKFLNQSSDFFFTKFCFLCGKIP